MLAEDRMYWENVMAEQRTAAASRAQLTGRTRHRGQMLTTGWLSTPSLVLVLQVEYRNIDPDRSPASDFLWRDASLEDLTMLNNLKEKQ
jgi:hypothetical protein